MVRDYERAEKKRKLDTPKPAPTAPAPSAPSAPTTPTTPAAPAPTPAQPVDCSSSDFDSDEFENVALDESDDETINGVSISFSEPKRQALTKHGRVKSDPKEHRLAVHKICLVSWFVHCHTRDSWLRSPLITRNKRLKTVLPISITSKLFPPSHLTPFLKSKTFIDGLRAAMEFWQTKFTILNPGLASNAAKTGDPSDYREYTTNLLHLQGSSDMLGQGFVALLRALNFRVRLVCSMQPPDNLNANLNVAKRKQCADSKCPLFWAEVRDEYVHGWVSVDPLTSTVRLPTKNCVKTAIEPPQNDLNNILRYCIAFESRGCRDVTKRYASAYNARTRKKRVSYVDNGVFLNKLYALYAPKQYTREDLAEIKELDKYPRLEGIPTRTQDFINHPVYALADNLHANEILKPDAKPCGTLALKNRQTTFIYKRSDVQIVRSEQSWYRRGRKVKIGVVAKKSKSSKNRLTGELDKVKLYTYDQTSLYKPDPVQADGTVPKSEYHSIDVFTPSMVPDGAVYIADKAAKKAARLLHVDYANAVIGVDFSRQGARSKVQGVVIAKQFEPAVLAAIQGIKEADLVSAEEAENARIMELWRKLIVGIQIWDRIETMNPEDSSKSDSESGSESSSESDAGGFVSDAHSSFSDVDIDDVSQSDI